MIDAPALAGGIGIEAVSFRYGEHAPPVLKDISVAIEPGQFVALVGPSGCGKSTLASLLVAMYQPTAGRIAYDGRDLAALDARTVRRQLGIVLQNPHVFNSSIRANIAFSDPTLSLDAVMNAARLAQVHDEIMAMPMGYETLLSPGGGGLSGGQIQRLALARALVRKPAILLLDEATSALDATTESRVQTSLDGLACTRIVIAHRLSTVLKADVILVMENGQIVETGTHHQLHARGGAYHRLVTSQLAG